MKKLIVILSLVILTNCAYRPVINPETSTNPKNYYKDLSACRVIYNEETITLIPNAEPDKIFLQKCLEGYGYTILR
jgi:hypothetical protein